MHEDWHDFLQIHPPLKEIKGLRESLRQPKTSLDWELSWCVFCFSFSWTGVETVLWLSMVRGNKSFTENPTSMLFARNKFLCDRRCHVISSLPTWVLKAGDSTCSYPRTQDLQRGGRDYSGTPAEWVRRSRVLPYDMHPWAERIQVDMRMYFPGPWSLSLYKETTGNIRT